MSREEEMPAETLHENAGFPGETPLIGADMTLKLRGGPEAAGAARRALESLDGVLHPRKLDDLRLLVTELVTNSVRHATEGVMAAVDLRIDVRVSAVRVEVADPGKGFEQPEAPGPRDDGTGGWGLYLVDSLSDRWGVKTEPGTCVWFEIGRQAA